MDCLPLSFCAPPAVYTGGPLFRHLVDLRTFFWFRDHVTSEYLQILVFRGLFQLDLPLLRLWHLTLIETGLDFSLSNEWFSVFLKSCLKPCVRILNRLFPHTGLFDKTPK